MKPVRVWSLVLLCSAYGCSLPHRFTPYSPKTFRGEGTIEDTGTFTYPRYHIRFPEISLIEPAEHTFRCSGLPPDRLTLSLQVVGTASYDTIKGVRTVVEAKVTNETGDTICRASGSLKEWVLQWSACGTGAFWAPECRNVRLPPGKAYAVALTVKEVDSEAPPLHVVPTLEGGGNELP